MTQPRGKRIAILSSDAYSLSNFRGPLMRAMVARGATVWALAPNHDAASRARIASFGAEAVDVSLERTGMDLLRDGRDLLALRRVLERIQPDTMLSYFMKPVLYGSLAARMAGVPHRFALIAGLGYTFSEEKGAQGMRRRLLRGLVSTALRRALRSCETVFFQNEEDRTLFIDRGLVGRANTHRLPGTGVALDRYEVTPPPVSPISFLMMARLLREKGAGEYAEAAKIVRARYPDTVFRLLGDVDPNPNSFTEVEIRAWVDEGVLEWPGHIDDVRPWIARSSVYVLPSYYREGVPRSSQEAMAMARPVITTDHVGCRETVEHGVTGLLVPIRDPAALADAMMQFVEDPSRIAVMGRAGRHLAETRFDADAINAEMLEVMGIGRRSTTKGDA